MRILIICVVLIMGISCHQGAIDDEMKSSLDSSSAIFVASGDKVQDFYTQYNSKFIRQETPVPLVVEAGHTFRIDVEYKNIGTETWVPFDEDWEEFVVCLWSISNPKNLWGKVFVGLPHEVAPGEIVEIRIRNLIAPSTPGTYYMQWKLLHNLYQLSFGEETQLLQIQVIPD